MKFSLRNVLLVIATLALWLGLILSDQKIQDQARILDANEQLIQKSKSFHLPLTDRELERVRYKIADVAQID